MITIKERIAKLRQESGMTQEAVARIAGISQSHWGMIELGVTKAPKANTLQNMARALGVTLPQLLEDVDFINEVNK